MLPSHFCPKPCIQHSQLFYSSISHSFVWIISHNASVCKGHASIYAEYYKGLLKKSMFFF